MIRSRFWLAAAVALLPIMDAHAGPLREFRWPGEAHRYCPRQTIVWGNFATGIYHYPGTRWYGRTPNGAFLCQIEAHQAGMRPAPDGQ